MSAAPPFCHSERSEESPVKRAAEGDASPFALHGSTQSQIVLRAHTPRHPVIPNASEESPVKRTSEGEFFAPAAPASCHSERSEESPVRRTSEGDASPFALHDSTPPRESFVPPASCHSERQ